MIVVTKKNTNTIHQLLINILVVWSSIPFISPIPFGSDLQPLILLFAVLIFLFDFCRMDVKVSKVELYFIFLAILQLFYLNIFANYSFKLSSHTSIGFAFLFYYLFSRYKDLIIPRFLFMGLYINFFGAVTQFLIPDIWSSTVGEYMISDFRAGDLSGSRGVGGFNPEAGFLGAIAVAYLTLSSYYFESKKIDIFSHSINIIASAFVLYLSSSGTGYLLFIIWLIGMFLLSNISYFIKVVLVTVFLVVANLVFSVGDVPSRGVEVISNLLITPGEFLQSDVSTLMRLLAFMIGPFSISDGMFLGTGVGTFDSVAPVILDKKFSFIGDSEATIRLIDANGGSSAFGRLSCEMGLFFVFLIILLLLRSRKKGVSFLLVVFSMLFISFSFSFSFPLTWIMFGICKTDKNKFPNKG